MAVGGFPSDLILGEDACAVGRLILNGGRVAYVAEACVRHSHDYSVMEEFRRYFDIGVFHARQSWLLQAFGTAGGEGGRFVTSEWKYLLRHAPWLLPLSVVKTGAKWLGYRLGQREGILPLAFKRWCSMHKHYWKVTS